MSRQLPGQTDSPAYPSQPVPSVPTWTSSPARLYRRHLGTIASPQPSALQGPAQTCLEPPSLPLLRSPERKVQFEGGQCSTRDTAHKPTHAHTRTHR